MADNGDILYDNGIEQLNFSKDNQYLVYSVYGNAGRDDVPELISIYKRSLDGNTFNLVRKLFKTHSMYGSDFSVIGSKMFIVGAYGGYVRCYLYDLYTQQL